MEDKKELYPDNLLADIFGDDFKSGRVLADKPGDFDATLEYVLRSCLSERGQRVISMRYKMNMGYKDIAAMLNMEMSNVHNAIQQPLRRLQHYRIKQMLEKGMVAFIESVRHEDLAFYVGLIKKSPAMKDEEKQKVIAVVMRTKMPEEGLDTISIEMLDIPVRAYNILRQNGVETIKDLLDMGGERLLTLPKLGAHSAEIVKTAVRQKFCCVIK